MHNLIWYYIKHKQTAINAIIAQPLYNQDFYTLLPVERDFSTFQPAPSDRNIFLYLSISRQSSFAQ